MLINLVVRIAPPRHETSILKSISATSNDHSNLQRSITGGSSIADDTLHKNKRIRTCFIVYARNSKCKLESETAQEVGEGSAVG
jgi:hypothetical protein